MLGTFTHRIHGRDPHVSVRGESALLTAGAVFLTLVTILILFLGVLATQAS